MDANETEGDCVLVISEEMFPRLGQMIVDFESPVKKMSEEFIPHAKVLTGFMHWLWHDDTSVNIVIAVIIISRWLLFTRDST